MSEHGRSQVRSEQFEHVIRQARPATFGSVQKPMTRIETKPGASSDALPQPYDVDIIQHRVERRGSMPGSRHSAMPFD